MSSHSLPIPAVPDPGRRRLLQLGAVAASALPVAGANAALARPAAQLQEGFTGPGYYLYPAWGEPALYHVSELPAAHAGLRTLAFRNPASGKLLWTQSLAGEADFAGRLLP